MGVYRTRGEPGEIKKKTQPKYITALFREQVQLASIDRKELLRLMADAK